MRNRSTILSCAALLAAVSVITGQSFGDEPDKKASSKPIDLKLDFRKGRGYYVESTSDVTQKIDMGGQTMNQVIKSTSGVMESVEDVVEDTATLALRFDRLAMQIAAGPMPPMKYDSDSDEGAAPQLKQVFEPMLNKSMSMKVTKAGDVKSLSGMDEIKAEISKKVGMNPIWMQMQAGLNDEFAKVEYGETRFDFLPDGPVAVGDTWKKERRRQLPGISNATISKTEYTLTDVKMIDVEGQQRRVALIEFTGTIQPDPDAPKPDAGNGRPMPEIESGTSTGAITFDLKRGLPILKENVDKISLTMKGSPMGDLKVAAEKNQKIQILSRKAREAQNAGKKASADASAESAE